MYADKKKGKKITSIMLLRKVYLKNRQVKKADENRNL